MSSDRDKVAGGTASFEEATRCPKCNEPGELGVNRPGPDKSTIHFVWCRNQVCKWFDTNWIVQQLEDGTVPVRPTQDHRAHQKTFPAIPSYTQQQMRDYLKGIDDTNLPPEGRRR